MLISIKFNRQFFLITIKIKDVTSNRMLSSELRSSNAAMTQNFLQQDLGISHVATQFFRPNSDVVGKFRGVVGVVIFHSH